MKHRRQLTAWTTRLKTRKTQVSSMGLMVIIVAEKNGRKEYLDDEMTTVQNLIWWKGTVADNRHHAKGDESIDVQAFFVRDCDAAAKQLIDHAKRRCDELKKEFGKAKDAILQEIIAQKENLPAEEDEEEDPPLAYDIIVQCVAGPYKGNSYILHMDLDAHPTCLIGRSTGKKFRVPHGLSFPKDSELSTTHGQLRLKEDGALFFTDLDSTNGSYLNDAYLTPQEPTPLSLTEPFKLYLGGSELVLSIVKRQS